MIANEYYVATDGDDNNPGTIDQPWQSTNKAANEAQGGDVVYFREGTYNGTLLPRNSGSPNNWVTFTAYPGEHVEIVSTDNDGVTIRTLPWDQMDTTTYDEMLSYIEVSGLGIQGVNKAVRIDHAHHIRLINNVLHDSGSAGIGAANGKDHILIESNLIYGNSNGTAPCSSGISIWNSGCFFGESNTCKILNDGAPTYHVIIRNNLIYANRNDDSECGGAGGVTDGNGIIMDNNGALNPPALIANNIIMRNGARCIQVLNTSNVHAVNNTCYENVQTQRLIDNGSGELQIAEHEVAGYEMDTTNVTFKNNLVYGHGGAYLYRVWGTIYEYSADYNLFFNGLEDSNFDNGVNTIIDVDPLFVSLPTCSSAYSCDWQTADFHLQSGSPAIDVGTDEFSALVNDDYDGTARPVGSGYDIGAFER